MSRRDQFLSLRHDRPHVLPSLLSADFGNLQREVERLEEAGVRGLHLDVMDGCFVPNLTFGMLVVAALRRLTRLPLDVHLMICDPHRYLESFYEAGADCLTIHVEAVRDPRPLLERIRTLGAAAGLALNPATDLSLVEPHLDWCDLVLVMSVPAGFGGQTFDDVALEKLNRLREQVGDGVLFEVDGGVNRSTIRSCVQAGAQLLVAGSAVFQNGNYAEAIRQLDRLASTPE
jgi:ribulose-phosphate 3-epimerase